MAAFTADDVAEYFTLADDVFDRRLPDHDRLPKIDRVICLRERIGMPLDFTLHCVGANGSRAQVHYRPYHREAERIRERMRIKEAFAL